MFPCPHCEKSYLESAHLKKHIMGVHENKFRYLCDECDFKTNSSSAFKKHMLLHSGETPFKCNVCGKGFRCKWVLNNHKDTHLTDEEKYKFTCQYCGSMFTRKVNMTVHIKSHHPDEIQK